MGPLRRRSGAPHATTDERVGRSQEAPDVTARWDVVEIRSFKELYELEWGPLVGLAYTLTGSRETAEELVQEAMLRAYRNWGRISSYDKPGTWVRRALLNLTTSWWRRQRSAGRALLRWNRAEVVDLQHDTGVVWAAVRRLPRRQAEVVALHYGCDLSIDDIAEILDCAPGTVRTHLTRARVGLALLLREVDS